MSIDCNLVKTNFRFKINYFGYFDSELNDREMESFSYILAGLCVFEILCILKLQAMAVKKVQVIE